MEGIGFAKTRLQNSCRMLKCLSLHGFECALMRNMIVFEGENDRRDNQSKLKEVA